MEQNKWIRAVGSDITQGEVIGHEGDILGAGEVSVLISVGTKHVQVVRKLVVGILSTGDELVDMHSEIPQGSYIRDSNRPMLKILVEEISCIVKDYGIVQDEYEILKSKIMRMIEECDLIITTGGVSMGDKDYVKPIIEEIGEVRFGRINMKPGKPTTFGTVNGKYVFALPGNPVSCYVTFHLLVKFAICLLSRREYYPVVKVDLGNAKIKLDPERPEYHRAVITWKNDKLYAVSTGNQISSRLLSTKNANGLLILKSGNQSQTHASGSCEALLIGDIKSYNASIHTDLQPSSHICPHEKMSQQKVSASVAVVTISDGCYRGEREDRSGPELQSDLSSLLSLSRSEYRLIPDEAGLIESTLISLSDEGFDCIITTGGTGFSV
jgi:molybdenum cofactor synthesis domain-containing protein